MAMTQQRIGELIAEANIARRMAYDLESDAMHAVADARMEELLLEGERLDRQQEACPVG